jgi:uncharacterized protein (TIGR00725 family)
LKGDQIYIGVIGEGVCSEETAQVAYEVGRRIGERRAILVCGGRGGVMENAAKGAKSVGGLTVGVLPGSSRDEANPYIDIAIVTGMGEARNVILVQSCQVLIAVEGMYGTLSEIAFACKFGIPVIGLKTWKVDRPGLTASPVLEAKTPEEGVEMAFQIIHSRKKE